jgi:hypothetical protein
MSLKTNVTFPVEDYGARHNHDAPFGAPQEARLADRPRGDAMPTLLVIYDDNRT